MLRQSQQPCPFDELRICFDRLSNHASTGSATMLRQAQQPALRYTQGKLRQSQQPQDKAQRYHFGIIFN